ncbi:MAG: hypothetical protein ACYC6A_04925 [Armatimonadota bacterium]
MRMTTRLTPLAWLAILLGTVLTIAGTPARGQEATEERLQELERQVEELQGQREQADTTGKVNLAGYGEIHFNGTEGPAKDKADLHRFVLYFGYDFAEWARLHSELEVEHALVKDNNGYLVLEQLFVELDGNEWLNGRIGRVLMPLGIINEKHEPTTFNGVERPLVDKVIIPSTWFSDGAGLFGNLGPQVQYQAYLTSSLDASRFDAMEGIRGGRMTEEPGLSQLAVSGRVDYFPLANKELGTPQNLRLGLGYFGGGASNKNKGAASTVSADVTMYAADAEYSIGRFDLRGVWALGKIGNAAGLPANLDTDTTNNVASEILGWYLEGAVHVLPDRWKQGKLRDADAVLFARYEKADTQHKMPASLARNLAGDRTETTFGINFYPTANLVLKADYQIRDSASATKPANLFNAGVGWMF